MELLLFGNEVLHAGDARVGLLMTSSRSASARAACWPAASRATRSSSAWCRSARSAWASSALCAVAVARIAIAAAATARRCLASSAACFVVPLNASCSSAGRGREGPRDRHQQLLQHARHAARVGRAVAAGDKLALASAQMMVVVGVFTLLVDRLHRWRCVPDFLVRFVLWLLTHTIYRIRIVGRKTCPHAARRCWSATTCRMSTASWSAPACSASSASWCRAVLTRCRLFNWFLRRMHAIPVTAGNRREVRRVDRARAPGARRRPRRLHLRRRRDQPHRQLLPFKRGLERIVEGLDVPMIPVHLDRVWGSIFSFEGGSSSGSGRSGCRIR